MEYVDRQQNIKLTQEDLTQLYYLDKYIITNIDYTYYKTLNMKNLYINGLTVEVIETEYKDLPLDWVISLFL